MAEACPACGGDLAPWLQAPPLDPTLGGPFALLRCTRCASARTVEPAPADAHESGTYGSRPPRAGALVRAAMRVLLGERLKMVRRIAGPAPGSGPLLDVGAGRGGFVLAASSAGWDAAGIEPSERRRARAAQRGARVARASIAGADIAPGSLALATMWHVLEHVEDPQAELARVAGWLAPGGLLVVAVPNLRSTQARIGGRRWFALDLPRHRTHFTPEGLRALLGRGDLEIIGRAPRALVIDGAFGMWQSLVNRLTPTPSYLYNLLRRNVSLRALDLALTLALLPLAPLALLAEAAAALAGRGGTIVIAARRPR